jgi:hypothetical protein
MSDEAAGTIHNVCLSLLTHLDLRHDVPDEFEVDLCDSNARVATVPRQCEGHVGFRLGAKIDRAVIGLACDGLEEFRIL